MIFERVKQSLPSRIMSGLILASLAGCAQTRGPVDLNQIPAPKEPEPRERPLDKNVGPQNQAPVTLRAEFGQHFYTLIIARPNENHPSDLTGAFAMVAVIGHDENRMSWLCSNLATDQLGTNSLDIEMLAEMVTERMRGNGLTFGPGKCKTYLLPNIPEEEPSEEPPEEWNPPEEPGNFRELKVA